jgi:outer membrane protein assembly factor BamB
MPAAVGVAVAGMAVSACHVFDIFGNKPAGNVSLVWLVPGEAAAAPGVDGSTVFYLGSDHYVNALDAASGHERWRSTTGAGNPSPVTGNCAVVGDVTVCGDGGIFAFRRDDGSLVWRFDANPDSPGHFPVAVINNLVVGGSWGFGTIYAIDGATGALVWTAPVLRSDTNGVNITRLAGDSDIVVGTFVRGGRPETGGVIAVDAGTGNVRWVTNFPPAAPDSACAGLEVA